MTSEAELERQIFTPEEIERRHKQRAATRQAYIDRLDKESAELTAAIGDGLRLNQRRKPHRIADLIRKLIRVEVERLEFRELTIGPVTRLKEKGLWP